ncbi:hypothetical protein [Mesorhizobium sp. M0678]|uniref:hypothetical protein n=1 Tax=Mesorhizobium sp. M0678 TaxID=2956985 RepID=UPI003335C074
MDGRTEHMPAWMAEHADNTQQLVFGQLVTYLEEIVPSFSGAELRRRVEDMLEAAGKKAERNVVTSWMEREEKEIISTMIPRSIHD